MEQEVKTSDGNQEWFNIEKVNIGAPDLRLTIWEAKQLISAELFEYIDARRQYVSNPDKFRKEIFCEAIDIFGYMRYFSIPLFIKACNMICKKDINRAIYIYSAYLVLTTDEPYLSEEKDKWNFDFFNNHKVTLRRMFRRWKRKYDQFAVLKNGLDTVVARVKFSSTVYNR